MLNNRIDAVVQPATFGELDAVLDQTRKAIRLADYSQAQTLLEQAQKQRDREAAEYFNLMGALHEGRGHRWRAKRYYAKANALKKTFEPAKSNLQRLDHVETASQQVKLGDENEGIWYAHLPYD